ncbi:hypothetical protein [Tritonibacter scottomollicae]|uniref:hypothetical protein n=1 Tax=Tritonibacter scottomollicae TaxID=483013 RepID=UPI003AA852BB
MLSLRGVASPDDLAGGATLPMTLRRIAMATVMAAAVLAIFVETRTLTLLGSGALVLYLLLAWRQFRIGTWVPVLLSVAVLALALWQDVAAQVLWQAADRMVFLSALIAMLGTLRSAAAIAPEVLQAGAYVTNQPASRRYLAMTFGGHLFGVLINFGGLALLLDLAKREVATDAAAQTARRRARGTAAPHDTGGGPRVFDDFPLVALRLRHQRDPDRAAGCVLCGLRPHWPCSVLCFRRHRLELRPA